MYEKLHRPDKNFQVLSVIKFDVKKGTEQGHPLSPDLFKIYIRDLSPQLDHDNCPKLMNQLISHLLWADDLILLALDPETLQKQWIPP